MILDGLHHVTMITGDAQRIVAFYADLLGLRLVKKTVNFDAPEAYHLYFGDEHGSPGSILTWFEFAGAAQGRPGVGMIHELALGVGSPEALDFWAGRLGQAGHVIARTDDGLGLSLTDPDGLALELVVADARNLRLAAVHPQVPEAHAIVGLEGARAYADAGEDRLLTQTLGLLPVGRGEYRLEGEQRHFRWSYDEPPSLRGRPGAGTVHHIAWGTATDEQQVAWREQIVRAGTGVSPVYDRDYFRSIYFREPRGILFEIATRAPGFAVDEDEAHLGERLALPSQHEHLRPVLERRLSPIGNPRAAQRKAAAS